MMDSVTRIAMAQRESDWLLGSPRRQKDIHHRFSMLPKLLERTGTNENGTITAIYTVLVDGDDFNEPIADAVREYWMAIFLDRNLANKGQYPAINILRSISRLMSALVDKNHQKAANRLRDLLNTYLSRKI